MKLKVLALLLLATTASAHVISEHNGTNRDSVIVPDNTTVDVFTAEVKTGGGCAIFLEYHYFLWQSGEVQAGVGAVSFLAMSAADDGGLSHGIDQESSLLVVSSGTLIETWGSTSYGANSVTVTYKADSTLDGTGTLWYTIAMTSGCVIVYQ